jgi:hypothetical protein
VPELLSRCSFPFRYVLAIGPSERCILINEQIFIVKGGIWTLSFVVDLDSAHWDDAVVNGLYFLSNYVLQVPFLLMTLMGSITPTLDELYGSFSGHSSVLQTQKPLLILTQISGITAMG